jgi:sugar phosphate isomerase/epimerase
MKLSLGSWAFSFGPYAANPVSFEAVVRRLSAAGFDGIDVSGFPPHVTLEEYPSRPSRLELVRFLEDHSLGVSGYSADFSEVNPIITENERRYLDLLRRNVQMAVDIGSPSLRIDSVTAPGSLPDDEYDRAFHRLARIWAEGAEIAQNAGVRLVWEFEPGFVFNKPEEIVRMHQEVRHPNFSKLLHRFRHLSCLYVRRGGRAPAWETRRAAGRRLRIPR